MEESRDKGNQKRKKCENQRDRVETNKKWNWIEKKKEKVVVRNVQQQWLSEVFLLLVRRISVVTIWFMAWKLASETRDETPKTKGA